jgi:hypothetical protein
MTQDARPSQGGAARDGAPPPQQPPPYDAPTSSAQQHGASGSEQLPQATQTKPEGSAYASSYRPEHAQSLSRSACVPVRLLFSAVLMGRQDCCTEPA